jgi:hypothetical protein
MVKKQLGSEYEKSHYVQPDCATAVEFLGVPKTLRQT